MERRMAGRRARSPYRGYGGRTLACRNIPTPEAPAYVSPLPPRSQVLTFLHLPPRSCLRVSAPPRQIHSMFGPGFAGSGSGCHPMERRMAGRRARSPYRGYGGRTLACRNIPTPEAPAHVSPLPPRSQVLTFLHLPPRSCLRVSAPPSQIHSMFGSGFAGSGSGCHPMERRMAGRRARSPYRGYGGRTLACRNIPTPEAPAYVSPRSQVLTFLHLPPRSCLRVSAPPRQIHSMFGPGFAGSGSGGHPMERRMAGRRARSPYRGYGGRTLACRNIPTPEAPAYVSPLPPRSQVLTFLHLPPRSCLRVSAPPRQIHSMFGSGFAGSGSGCHPMERRMAGRRARSPYRGYGGRTLACRNIPTPEAPAYVSPRSEE